MLEPKKTLSTIANSDKKIACILHESLDCPFFGAPPPACPEYRFSRICRSIVGQQLSTKAAKSIWDRLVKQFGYGDELARNLVKADEGEVRLLGLSKQKCSYIRNLAVTYQSGSLPLVQFDSMFIISEHRDDLKEDSCFRVYLRAWRIEIHTNAIE